MPMTALLRPALLVIATRLGPAARVRAADVSTRHPGGGERHGTRRPHTGGTSGATAAPSYHAGSRKPGRGAGVRYFAVSSGMVATDGSS